MEMETVVLLEASSEPVVSEVLWLAFISEPRILHRHSIKTNEKSYAHFDYDPERASA